MFVKISDCDNTKIVVSIVVIILSTTIFPWIINTICSPTYGEWVGFLGNYIGALVSGIISASIAYGVAKFQINAENKRGSTTAITVVQIILEKLVKEYAKAISFEDKCHKEHLDMIEDGYGGNTYTKIADKEWDFIYIINDTDAITQLIKIKDEFNILLKVQSSLNMLRSEKEHVDKLINKENQTQLEITQIVGYAVAKDLVETTFKNVESKLKDIQALQIKLKTL